MPVLAGFGVHDALGPERMPAVIFVTAYDADALRAFDVHALDYLLKPFDRERFREALSRVRAHLQHRDVQALRERLANLIETYEAHRDPAPPRYASRLALKNEGRVYFLEVDRVDWAEAAGNYVSLHVGRKTHLMRETMNNLEARLDPDAFIRIHRSLIVRIDRIASLKPLTHGGYEVVLHDGRHLQASRTYRDRLRALFGG
jgi:two-component system LytT family response regulator